MKWEKRGVILKTEDLKADWIVSHVQLPVPLKLDNKILRIYFASRNEECHSYPIYIDVDINSFNVLKIHTEPLLELGKTGSFDENGITFSSCINYKGKIYMYYIGWNKGYKIPYKNAIGLAISDDDGNSFYKYSEGPLLDRCMDYPYFVASPFVRVEKEHLEMYFLSCTKWEYSREDGYVPYYMIKKASSDDGIHWHDEGDCINYKNDHEAIAKPWVMKNDDKYYMWYSYRDTYDFRKNKNNTYMIGLATSNDAKKWMRRDECVGIKKSNSGWDGEMMCYASIVENESKLIMIYNGNEHGKYAFGYATCDLEELRGIV
jgi:hypothetical protein